MAGIITNDGKNVILNRFGKSTPDYTPPTYAVISGDDTTPSVTDSTYTEQLPKNPTNIEDCDAVTGWSNSGDADAETSNTTSGEYKEGDGCLNLPMTNSGGSGYWQKTVTSVDMSDGGFVWLWYYISDKSVYLTDASDTIILELGTGGFTNSSEWNFAYSTLSDGWNLLICDLSSSDTDNGTGVDTSDVDSIRITVKDSATIGTNNQRMDYWAYASVANMRLSQVSGYPTFTEADREMTNRFFVGATEMNSYTMRKIYVINSDATYKLIMEDTFTEQGKTDKLQTSFILKTEAE